MNSSKCIKLKAAFLLLAFALNTVIAFACSLGLKMGYNNHHHAKVLKTKPVNARHCSSHQPGKNAPAKDDCCSNAAIKFHKEDKKLQASQNVAVSTPVFVAFMSSFFDLQIKYNRTVGIHKSILSQYYPPPDTRVFIQSFQV